MNHLTPDLAVKVTRNVTQYPLHHMTYVPLNFEADTPKALEVDAFTKKNVTDGRTHTQTDGRWADLCLK